MGKTFEETRQEVTQKVYKEILNRKYGITASSYMENATLLELKGEMALIRRRRAEIAAMDHPSQCREEYIRLCKREAEITGEIEFKYMIGAEMRRRIFGPC